MGESGSQGGSGEQGDTPIPLATFTEPKSPLIPVAIAAFVGALVGAVVGSSM